MYFEIVQKGKQPNYIELEGVLKLYLRLTTLSVIIALLVVSVAFDRQNNVVATF